MPPKMPVARSKDLIVKELENEFLIYDIRNDKALCLSSFTKEVWGYCDGLTLIDEAVSNLEKQHKSNIDENLIWLVIDELEKNNLLESKSDNPNKSDRVSRRDILFKYSFLGLPLIVSIVAPSAVSAQSTPACPAIPPGCNGNIPGGIPQGCPCSLNCSNCVGGMGSCNLALTPPVCV